MSAGIEVVETDDCFVRIVLDVSVWHLDPIHQVILSIEILSLGEALGYAGHRSLFFRVWKFGAPSRNSQCFERTGSYKQIRQLCRDRVGCVFEQTGGVVGQAQVDVPLAVGIDASGLKYLYLIDITFEGCNGAERSVFFLYWVERTVEGDGLARGGVDVHQAVYFVARVVRARFGGSCRQPQVLSAVVHPAGVEGVHLPIAMLIIHPLQRDCGFGSSAFSDVLHRTGFVSIDIHISFTVLTVEDAVALGKGSNLLHRERAFEDGGRHNFDGREANGVASRSNRNGQLSAAHGFRNGEGNGIVVQIHVTRGTGIFVELAGYFILGVCIPHRYGKVILGIEPPDEGHRIAHGKKASVFRHLHFGDVVNCVVVVLGVVARGYG